MNGHLTCRSPMRTVHPSNSDGEPKYFKKAQPCGWAPHQNKWLKWLTLCTCHACSHTSQLHHTPWCRHNMQLLSVCHTHTLRLHHHHHNLVQQPPACPTSLCSWGLVSIIPSIPTHLLFAPTTQVCKAIACHVSQIHASLPFTFTCWIVIHKHGECSSSPVIRSHQDVTCQPPSHPFTLMPA